MLKQWKFTIGQRINKVAQAGERKLVTVADGRHLSKEIIIASLWIRVYSVIDT